MYSPKSQPLRRISLLVFILFSFFELRSQCDPPDQLPTVFCVDAPLTCLQDACYSTSNDDNFGWNGWCGDQTAVHNPQYFMVIVTAPDVQINIHVDACEQGSTALQSALVTHCGWQPCPGNQVPCPDILDCDPGTGIGGTMVLTASGQALGDTLWLLIDGSSGSQCQYTIDFATGIYEPIIDEEITEGGATPDVVCQGFDDLMLDAGDPITNAHGYFWVLSWNNQVITSTLPSTTLDIPDNAPPGMWEICVQAFSGCDTSDIPFCFPLEIVEIDDVEKEPASFCEEDFGFDWHGIGIDGPGTYMKTFNTPDGCPYDTIWEVDAFPEIPVGQLEVLHCFNENFDPYVYEGESYYDTGTYPLDYPGQGLNGCDSTAELHLTLAGLDAFIDLSCENGEFVLTPLVQEVVPGNTVIEWQWFEAGGGSPIFDNIPLNTLDGGCYELYGTITTPLGSCVFLVGNEPFCFDPEQYWPEGPNMGFTDTIVCAQPGVFFTVIEDPFGEELDYVWTGPADAPLFQDGSGTVEIDFSNSAGGSVCVYGIGACGIGETTCFDVDIQTTPVSVFAYDPTVCNGDMTTVTFTGTAGSNTEVLWNFDNPDFITGSGLGPYTMSWNIDGDKQISLQLIQPGCDTSSYTGIITISSLIPPGINCTSTINSITFDWDDVAGANGYTVSLNGGAPTNTASSIQVVNGLNPNDMVTMILTVISAGACPNFVDTMTCTAENCPPPSIIISGQDSACLNAPAIIDLEVLVNGSPGVGVWSGPGIVDAALGLFDPKVAGSGQHQVEFATDLMGCAFTEQYLMTVFDSLMADFTLDPIICITDLATVTYTGNAPSGANFAFDFGSAVVTSGTGAGPFELSYATAGTKTVRLQVSDNGCTSELITNTLEVGASLNQPAVNCQAQTSSVKLCWTPDPLVSGYIVNTLTTHTGVESSNCIDFTGLVPGDSVSIEILSQTAGPCPPRADTFYCIARQCPPVDINITPVPDICLYTGTSPVNLEAVVTGGNGVGDWSGPGIIDVVNGRFDPFIAGAGSHLISYHYLDDGCDFLETTTINVADPPVAFVSNVSFVLTCAGGNKLLLDGSGSSGASLVYEWTTTDGVINTGATSPMAEVIKEGVYQLKVTSSASGCVDSTSVTVTKDANTPNSVAGEDRVLTCDSTSFVLGGGSSVGTNIIYEWTTLDGNIIGPINGQQITVDKVGEYNISVKDTVNGCESTDRALVTIDTSLASLSLTPGDTIDCNTTISGVQSTLNEPVSDYNFLWNTVDGTIVGSNTTPDVDVSQGGLYTLTIENKMNGCEKSASATVPESDEIIDGVDVSQMNITCFGYDNGSLVINGVIGGISPYTYSWSVSPQGGTSLTSLSPGQYTLTVTDQNGCTFTQVFDITEPIKITVDLGPDQVVAGEDTVTISLVTNINSDAIMDIEWSGYDGLSCPGCQSIQFVATSSGNIKAILTDTAGCVASDSMHLRVVVPRIIFIPNVFTPNDDGTNDYFFISGRKNLIGINYLRIYDRWGNQLFENNDFLPGEETEGWDGRYKGQYMLPGVYVYVAELQYEDITETVKGSITILR